MTTSTVKIYSACRIQEDKNFQVDSIETYLTGLSPFVVSNFQYVKQGLNITIKINLPQSELDGDQDFNDNYNYLSIKNSNDSKTYYYFITAKKWLSTSAVEYTLKQDVINTWQGTYDLTKKTNIIRQHKDRVKKINTTAAFETTFSTTLSGWTAIVSGGFRWTGTKTITRDEYSSNIIDLTGTCSSSNVSSVSVSFNNTTSKLTMTVVATSQGSYKCNITGTETFVGYIRQIDKNFENLQLTQLKESEETVYDTYTSIYDESDRYKDEDICYLEYKAASDYQASDPNKFIYDNAINVRLYSNKFRVVHGPRDTDISVANLKAYMSTVNAKSFLICWGGIGKPNKSTENSFTGYADKPTVDWTATNSDGTKTYNSGKIDLERVSLTKNTGNVLYGSMYGNYTEGTIGSAHWTRYNTWDSHSVAQFDLTGTIHLKNVANVKIYLSTSDVPDSDPWNKFFGQYSAGSKQYSGTDTNESWNIRDISANSLTDSKLVKIFQLPYWPISMPNLSYPWKITNTETDPSGLSWRFCDVVLDDSYFSKRIADTLAMKKELVCTNDNKHLSTLRIDRFTPSTTMSRDDFFESKLYSSDIQQYKFVYDSFSYSFKPEFLDIANADLRDDRFICDYIVSNTVQSSLAFDFSKTYPLESNDSDYNILVVNRNLEMPIFNNYYMQYMRNGYNYDVKNKQRSDAMTAVGAGLSAATLIAGIAMTATGVGSALGAGAIVGGISGLAGTITNGIIKSNQQADSIAQKMQQARAQGASVQGADDVGLLGYYTDGNKAKLEHWSVIPEVKSKVADLFYYCGYAINKQGIPNTTSRYWFNFVQCEPDIAGHWNMNNDMLEALVERYKEGITVLHFRNNTWDFDQVKENWETSIL